MWKNGKRGLALKSEDPARYVIVRRPDVCPSCQSLNTIRIDRSFRDHGHQRVAYGYCRECQIRIVIREPRRLFP